MWPEEKDALQKQNPVQVILAINLIALNSKAILKSVGIIQMPLLLNNAETDCVQMILHPILMIYAKNF